MRKLDRIDLSLILFCWGLVSVALVYFLWLLIATPCFGQIKTNEGCLEGGTFAQDQIGCKKRWEEARMSIGVIGGGVPAGGAFACTNNGDLLVETFDPTGYDDADWAESDTGGTINEDLSAPAVAGFNGQCLRTYITGTYKGARSTNTIASQATIYSRVYLYVQAENLADTKERHILRLGSGNGTEKIVLAKNGAQLELRLYTNGTLRDTENISVQTSYLIEVYLNNTVGNDTWEWKIDGVSKGTATAAALISADTTTLVLGIIDEPADDQTIDLYWDNAGLSSTGWLGSCQ